MANLYGKIVFDNEPHTYYRQYEGNQLGSGAGKIGQLMASVSRDKSGDGHKYRKQIEYFYEVNEKKLREKALSTEISRFVNSKSLLNRIGYAFTGELYRQKKIETFVFYAAIILGKV